MKDYTDKLIHTLEGALTVLCALLMHPIFADHPVNGKAYFELVNNTDAPIQFDKITTGFGTRLFPAGTRAQTKEAAYIISPHSTNKIEVRWTTFGPGGSYGPGAAVLRGELPWSDIMASTAGSEEQIAEFIQKLHQYRSLDVPGCTLKYTIRRTPDNAMPYYEILQPERVYESPERIAARREDASRKAFEQSLFEAADRGDLKAAKKLLADHPNININVRVAGGKTPLTAAALYNRKEMVNFLISHGADPNYGMEDITPLNVAVRENNPDMVKILLDGGANVNLRTGAGTTALYYAVQKGNKTIVKLLLDAGADVHARDREGRTAFDYLKKSNKNERAIRKLLDDAAKRQKTS